MTNLHFSRRRFLQLAGAAPLCAAFGAEKFAMPLVIFGKVFEEAKLTWEQSAATLAAAGFDGVDCTVRPKGEVRPERVAEDLPRYAEILRAQKQKIMLLTTAITEVGSPCAENILRAAKKAGVTYYRIGYWQHKAGGPSPEKVRAEVKAQLKDLAALNREIGVCAIFQNHSPNKKSTSRYVGGDLGEMRDVLQDFDPKQIACAFDLGHALIVHGDEWGKHFDALKPWLKIAYVKDTKRGTGFVPFGEGEFGGTDFFQRLRQMDYREPLSVHIEFKWSPMDQPTLQKILTDTRRVVGKWLA